MVVGPMPLSRWMELWWGAAAHPTVTCQGWWWESSRALEIGSGGFGSSFSKLL